MDTLLEDMMMPESDLDDMEPIKPKRHRRTREQIVADEAAGIERPKRQSRTTVKRSYKEDVKDIITEVFSGIAMVKMSPSWNIGYVIDPDNKLYRDMAEREIQSVDRIATQYDRWIQSLPDDSKLKKSFSSALESGGLVIATLGLVKISFDKAMLEKMIVAQMEQATQQSQNGYH